MAHSPPKHRNALGQAWVWWSQAQPLGWGKKDILLTRSHFLAKKKAKS